MCVTCPEGGDTQQKPRRARVAAAGAASGGRVRDEAQQPVPACGVPPGGGRGRAALGRAELAAPRRAGAARGAARGAAERRSQRGAAAATAARAGRGCHGCLVPASRRARAQMRQGVRAGGERGGRRAP